MSHTLTTSTIPRLQNGDTLDSDEFMLRYHAMPELKKAELLEGVVYLPFPMRKAIHGYSNADLLGWLGNYRLRTPNVRASAHATIRFDKRNVPQPDAHLRILHGGQSVLAQDGYLDGGPELVAEVAASSVSIDRNTKFRVYRDHGVREYVLWRVEEGEIDWFVLRDGQYVALPPGEDGILRSEVYPGLWLDPAAMVGLDAGRVHEVLLQGIASPDHAAFVERMRQLDP